MSETPWHPASRQVRMVARTTANRHRPSPVRVRIVACLIGGAGLLLVVVGSFLPWVVSGNVRRSSYAVVGVLDRLGIADDGAIGVVLAHWPLIGVLAIAPVVAAALRRWRTAGLLAVPVAFVAGLLSFGIVAVASGRVGLGIRLDPFGPAVMAAGAILLFGGALALALGAGSPIREIATRPNGEIPR
jgi:hypothetical protein